MTQLDVLSLMLEEHYEHARSHEDYRATATNFMLATSGLLLGFAVQSGDRYMVVILALVVVFLSVYGLLFCRKHYERFRFHIEIARQLREEMERCIKDVITDVPSYESIRTKAERDHFAKEITKRRESEQVPPAAPWAITKKLRLYRFYDVVNASLGIAAILVIIVKLLHC